MSDVSGTEVSNQSGRPVRVLVLTALLLAAISIALVGWWISRSGDLPVGSRHRVTVIVRPYVHGSCWNNIDDVGVGDHHWSTFAHAPDQWPVGEVSGWLEVTAPPSQDSPTATFTADAGGSVDFTGGSTGEWLSGMHCSISAPG